METPTTKVNIIQQPGQRPQNRKDLIIDAYLCYLRTIETGDIDKQIQALKNFIITANSEIPESSYSIKKLDEKLTDFLDYEKEYYQANPILIPQQKLTLYPRVKALYDERIRSILMIEYGNIHTLLKEHTAWLFDTIKKETPMIQ